MVKHISDKDNQNLLIFAIVLLKPFKHYQHDPGNGKTYNCSMKVEGDVLKVRGSLDKRGLVGRTMDWFRVK